ncbi:hypothetical protein [Bordetella genomosp. 5]|uniref:hypothetical protein n=1 Tax=Bordetella genomosp. 5 TaxID=1395608 RepID=UPI000B9E8100|nr:hypothetical protein [Bordetella genomosp. 5]
MNDKKRPSLRGTAILIMALTVLIWALAYPIGASLPENSLKEPLNSSYGVLNVLFTALAFGGVVITLIFQVNQAKEAQQESVERSISEMFQIFTSAEFQETKDAAFRVLIPAIRHRAYAEFVASRLYAVAQLPFPASESIKQSIMDLEGNAERAKTMEFWKMERADRLKLDDIFNFFAMLAQRNSASDVIKHVDFAYDWWRPALLLIAQMQVEHRERHPEIGEYCKGRPVIETVQRLDVVFGHKPLTSRNEIWAYLAKHPKMIGFGMDACFSAAPGEAGSTRKS